MSGTFPDKDYVTKIADGVLSAAYNYPEPDAFIHLFVDYVILLYFDGVYVVVSDRDRRRYSSLAEEDAEYLGVVKSSSGSGSRSRPCDSCTVGGLRVSVYHLRDSASLEPRLGALFNCMKRLDEEGSEYALELLSQALVRASERDVGLPRAERPVTALTDAQFWSMLDPFHKYLADLFGQFEQTKWPFYVQSRKCDRLVLNLFCVLRYFEDPARPRVVRSTDGKREARLPYTARLIASRSQREYLGQLWQELPGETQRGIARAFGDRPDLVQVFQWPLGQGSRAIADSVFRSGCVDCGLRGERVDRLSRERAGSSQDRARQQLETAVYEDLLYSPTGTISAAQRDSSIFYVPVHVGGTPWLALFLFYDPSDSRARELSYRLYRDMIPPLAAQIRMGAQVSYAFLLAEAVSSILTRDVTSAEFVEEVSSRWRDLARVYPFAIPDMRPLASTVKAEGVRVSFSDGQQYMIGSGWHDNPYFAAPVEYGRLDKTLASRYFLSPIAAARESAMTRGVARIAADVGHIVKRRAMPLARFTGILARTLANERHQLADLARYADNTAEVLAGVGELTHTLAYDEPLDFLKRENLRTQSDLYLKPLIARLASQYMAWDEDAACWKGVRLVGDISAAVRVAPWYSCDEGAYRPLDAVYVALLSELLINAARHGSFESTGSHHTVRVNLTASSVSGAKALVLRNPFDPDSAPAWIKDAYEWVPFRTTQPGGMGLVARVLARCQVGGILCRNERAPQASQFGVLAVALVLRGLEWSEEDGEQP